MKALFKIVSIIILIAALVGGAILVQRNQETRRGAASTDASTQILPNVISSSPGNSEAVFVWLNTGKDTDKLQGAEVLVSFDASKMNLVGFEPQNGYNVLDENTPYDTINKTGKYNFSMVTLGTEKSGAVSVAKLTFKMTGSGSASVVVASAKLMINGQSATWDVAKNAGSSVTISGNEPTTAVATVRPTAGEGQSCGGLRGVMCATGLTCEMPKPTNGQIIVDQTGICVKVAAVSTVVARPTAGEGQSCGGLRGVMCATGLTCEMPKPTNGQIIVDQTGICVKSAVGACGQRCSTNTECAKGLTCAPIWWQCGTLPTDLQAKLQQNSSFDAATIKQLTTLCPQVAAQLPSNYTTMSAVKLPTFYGVCRNTTCVSSADCTCKVTTPGPSIRLTTPTLAPGCRAVQVQCVQAPCPVQVVCTTPTAIPTTIVGNNQVSLSGLFLTPSAVKGDVVEAQIIVNSNGMKVSAVNTQILYNTDYFDFIESVPTSGVNVLKNQVDKNTGKLTVYISWSLPEGGLPVSPFVTKLKFKTKLAGIGTFRFDNNYVSEVSGLNSSGVSTGFKVVIPSTTPSISITDVKACMMCSSGLAKNIGNANCDNAVNSVDFEIWRSEMFDQGGLSGFEKSTWNADFSCDLKVSGIDFEIWRSTVFK